MRTRTSTIRGTTRTRTRTRTTTICGTRPATSRSWIRKSQLELSFVELDDPPDDGLHAGLDAA